MPLLFNNNVPDIVSYNNQEVETITYNNDVIWTKNVSAETWLLNDVLDTTIGNPAVFDNLFFTSDGVVFSKISIVLQEPAEILLKYDNITPYSTVGNKWASDKYKTLSFNSAPLGAVRIWLEANGSKIS